MPARRFFSLLKAKRKIECINALDRLDEALVASDNVSVKWYETLREKWIGRLKIADQSIETEKPKIEFTDETIKETQKIVLDLFRQRKRFMGYGG